MPGSSNFNFRERCTSSIYTNRFSILYKCTYIYIYIFIIVYKYILKTTYLFIYIYIYIHVYDIHFHHVLDSCAHMRRIRPYSVRCQRSNEPRVRLSIRPAVSDVCTPESVFVLRRHVRIPDTCSYSGSMFAIRKLVRWSFSC